MLSLERAKAFRLGYKSNQSLVFSIVALLCLFAIASLQIPRLNQLTTKRQTVSTENLRKEVEAEQLRLELSQKIPALGFDNLMANWAYLSFLQYFGDDIARQRTGYALSPEYFKIIVDRDPRFLDSYIALSTSISLYAGMPEKSIALMEQGLKSLSPSTPRAYYVWRYKAIDELLFLGDAKAAQQSLTMAAQWASAHPAPESQNIAFISARTAEFLATSPNLKPVQEGAWSMVLVNALNNNDERTRKLVINRIESQGGKVIFTPEGNVKVELP